MNKYLIIGSIFSVVNFILVTVAYLMSEEKLLYLIAYVGAITATASVFLLSTKTLEKEKCDFITIIGCLIFVFGMIPLGYSLPFMLLTLSLLWFPFLFIRNETK